MRVLVLSFYYEPDLCAGSFRNTALVQCLAKQLGDRGVVDVITTMPNRYHTYSVEAPAYEQRGNVRIRRIPLPGHRSGMVDQSRAFVAYAMGVWRMVRNASYDVIFASSSRLMTAVLGAAMVRRSGSLLYLDIRDIFTDSMGDLLRGSPMRMVMPLFRLLERFAIRRAARVNLISPGFVSYFNAMDTGKDFRLFTNGIDEPFLGYDFSCGDSERNGPREILYAGNIGEGQGLHRIVADAAKRLGEGWRFRIIGEGGMRDALERSVEGLDNVVLETPMPRAQLLERYKNADVLFLHLNDYPAFRRVLPSKLFEYAATGKPILAGVAGQASEFVEAQIENTAVFFPCDSEGLVDALGSLELKHMLRNEFVKRYRRSKITEQFASDVLDLGWSRQDAAGRYGQ